MKPPTAGMGTPHPFAVLRGHGADVQTTCFDADEKHLISGDAHGEVKVWSLADLRPVVSRRLHPVSAGVLNAALLPGAVGGRRVLVTQGRDGVTYLWDCSSDFREISAAPLRTFSRAVYSFCRFSLAAPPRPIAAAATSPGAEPDFVGSLLADSCAQAADPPSAVDAASLAALESAASRQRAIAAVHACPAGAASALPPALLAIPGNTEQQAEVCCCACGATVATISPEGAGLKLGICLALRLFLDAAGAKVLLASGHEDGTVAIWDLGSPAAPLASGKLHSQPLMALDIHPGGGGGVSGAAEDKLVLFAIDYSAGRIVQRRAVEVRKEGIGDVAVRPDGKIVVSAGWDGRVRLYKVRTGSALAVLKYHTSAGTAVAFSPRTFKLATGARDGTIALWDVYASEPPAEG